jgi:hypothetical protein
VFLINKIITKMESNVPLDSEIYDVEITVEARGSLLETAKWGRFLAIVGSLMMTFFLLMVLFMGGALVSQMNEIQGQQGLGVLGGTFWTVYLICIFVFIFFPLYYLYNFSIKTIRAINSTSTKNLTEGLKNLKSLFKFYGVFVATIVGFYLVIIVGGLLSTAVF